MSDCPFCKLIREGKVLVDVDLAVAIADAFPLNPGHTRAPYWRSEGA